VGTVSESCGPSLCAHLRPRNKAASFAYAAVAMKVLLMEGARWLSKTSIFVRFSPARHSVKARGSPMMLCIMFRGGNSGAVLEKQMEFLIGRMSQ
jgi:hypothetical protein